MRVTSYYIDAPEDDKRKCAHCNQNMLFGDRVRCVHGWDVFNRFVERFYCDDRCVKSDTARLREIGLAR